MTSDNRVAVTLETQRTGKKLLLNNTSHLGIHLFIFTKKCNFLTFNPRFIALGIFGKFSCCTLNRNEEHTLMLARRENDDFDRQNQHLMNDNAVKDKRYVFVYNNLQFHIVLLRKIIRNIACGGIENIKEVWTLSQPCSENTGNKSVCETELCITVEDKNKVRGPPQRNHFNLNATPAATQVS